MENSQLSTKIMHHPEQRRRSTFTDIVFPASESGKSSLNSTQREDTLEAMFHASIGLVYFLKTIPEDVAKNAAIAVANLCVSAVKAVLSFPSIEMGISIITNCVAATKLYDQYKDTKELQNHKIIYVMKQVHRVQDLFVGVVRNTLNDGRLIEPTRMRVVEQIKSIENIFNKFHRDIQNIIQKEEDFQEKVEKVKDNVESCCVIC